LILARIFEEAGHKLFLVGGAVRDALLGNPNKDFDFCTDALPDETIAILKKADLKVIPIGLEFGTVATFVEGEDIEITTFRTSESFMKGSRKPTVVFGLDLEKDLQRRDFTVNAMAISCLTGKLIDPFGGLEALKAGILDTPLDPERTFSDDPLRMLRAGRFQAKLGFAPAERITKAATAQKLAILSVSRERWFGELNKLLLGDHPRKGLEWLRETGLLGVLLPEHVPMVDLVQNKHHLHDAWEHTLVALKTSKQKETVRWALLCHDFGKPATRTGEGDDCHFLGHEDVSVLLWEGIGKRFRLPNVTLDRVRDLISMHMRIFHLPDPALKRSLRKLLRACKEIGDGFWEDLLDVSEADSGAKQEQSPRLTFLENVRQLAVQLSLEELCPRPPAKLGKGILDTFGIKPGPQVGEMIARVKVALEEGILKEPSVETCLQWLQDNQEG